MFGLLRYMRRFPMLEGGKFLPFLDTFTGANGASLAADWTGAAWDIQTNAARGSPTAGADLLASLNGDFANWTADDPDDWTTIGEVANDPEISEAATGEAHADTPTPGGGMCNMYTTGNTVSVRATSLLTVGEWYAVTINIDTVTTGSLKINGFANDPVWNTSGAKTATGRADIVNLQPIRAVAATDITFDDITCKTLTLSTLLASVDGGANNVTVQVKATITADTQAGVVACLDSAASPANFLLAYHDKTNATLVKCVAGIYTSLIDSAAAYAAGGLVKVVKSGTSVELWYNGNKIGATQTVSDAGIISNTRHGIFSSYASNRLDDFSLTSP